MPTFNYRAMDQSGHAARGQIDAKNDIDLELCLQRMGLDLITFRPATGGIFVARRAISLKELAMFCFQLEQLTGAGIPLLEGLGDMRDSSVNTRLRQIIGALCSAIEGGKTLSEALAEYSKLFGQVFISLIQAGEQTGKLPEVLNHLAQTLKWQDELLAQTRQLLAYPMFVLLVVLGTLVFLMVYLVPQIAGLLNNLAVELPIQTRCLIFLSQLFTRYGWGLSVLPVSAGILIPLALRRNSSLRYYFDRYKLHVPVFGTILRKIILARFTRYFALMYQTGIPILDAIRTCESIVANQAVAAALRHVHEQISVGECMSEGFRKASLFPPLLVRMIQVGERTGVLDHALLKISDAYDREVDESIQRMLTLLEPVLTVILGLLLGIIMLAVLGPVYDSFSKLRL